MGFNSVFKGLNPFTEGYTALKLLRRNISNCLKFCG